MSAITVAQREIVAAQSANGLADSTPASDTTFKATRVQSTLAGARKDLDAAEREFKTLKTGVESAQARMTSSLPLSIAH